MAHRHGSSCLDGAPGRSLSGVGSIIGISIVTGKVLASRYQLQDRLGVGGSSTVFRALDLRLDVPVAVKLLDPNVAVDEQALNRFLREARTAAKLKHLHVAQSLDCGVDDGAPFIVMELLEGQTLRDRLRERGRLSPAETAKILSDVAKAMQFAHTTGVVHRDLKPENVFLARDPATLRDGSLETPAELVKVLDFGIAKRSVASEQGQSGVVTEPGSIFGTPNYMSPEQIDARSPIDHRADIWALGIMAFECLTGRVPFGEQTLREQFLAICARPLPIPSQVAAVPAGFDQWFARAADRDVSARFSSIREAQKELSRLCSLDPSGSRSSAPAASVPEMRGTISESTKRVETPPDTAVGSESIAIRPLPAGPLNWLLLIAVMLVAVWIGKGWLASAIGTWGSSPAASASADRVMAGSPREPPAASTSAPAARVSSEPGHVPAEVPPTNHVSESTSMRVPLAAASSKSTVPPGATNQLPPSAAGAPGIRATSPKRVPTSAPPSDLVSRAVRNGRTPPSHD